MEFHILCDWKKPDGFQCHWREITLCEFLSCHRPLCHHSKFVVPSPEKLIFLETKPRFIASDKESFSWKIVFLLKAAFLSRNTSKGGNIFQKNSSWILKHTKCLRGCASVKIHSPFSPFCYLYSSIFKKMNFKWKDDEGGKNPRGSLERKLTSTSSRKAHEKFKWFRFRVLIFSFQLLQKTRTFNNAKAAFIKFHFIVKISFFCVCKNYNLLRPF